MVTALVTWAQRWNPVSNNSYRDESPVYLQITLNGEKVSPNDALQVAAFIGDECRAYARSFYQPTVQDQLPEDVFLLNVQGDPDNDAGATITFKAYYEGVVYKFTTTATWNGETIQPVPVKLTLDALSGVKLDDEVIIDNSGDAIVNKVEVSLPGTKDMASLVTLVYGADGKAATEVTGSEVDTSETELFLSWDGANAASYFTIDEAGKLEAVSETGENGVWLGMKVMIRDLKNTANGSYLESQAQISSTSFSVVITKANILVSSITCDITELTVHVGDNILTALDEHISIEPDDATDNTYILYDTNGLLNQNYIATKSGKTVVSIEANSPADGVTPAQVNLTVLDYINEITASQQEVTVEVGDNALDAIKGVISWTPSGDYVDAELVFTPTDATLYNSQTGVALKSGSTAVTVTPKNSPATHLPSVTITLIVNEKANPVTAIDVTGKAITVYVGDDVKEAIKDQVTYTPADADEGTKDFTVEETDNVSKGTAIKPGECDVHVYAANDNSIVSTKTVHVTVVALPDYINGPDELTVNVGDNVKDAIEAVITIGSTEWDNDATASQYIDKTYTLSTNTNTAYYDQNYKATRVTENAITITVTTNGKDKTGAPLTKSINLTIKQGVTSLTAETTTINAIIGDNVFGMIQKLVQVNPSEATNQNITLIPDKASDDAFSNGIAIKAGQWTIVVTSDDNPNATITFTVNVAEPVSLTFDPVLETIVGKEVTLTITQETGGTIDPSKVQVVFSTTNNKTVPVTATPDATGLVWTIKASMPGTFTFYVSYDGVNQYSIKQTETGTLTVKQVIAPDTGWDWITVNAMPAGSRSIVLYGNSQWVPEMQNSNGKVIEIRSQTALLYNDPTYGLFGDITELKPSDGMYKIKTEGSVVFDLGTDVSAISASDLPTTVKGYTWLGYPHQIDQPLTALASALASTAEDGDLILGKDNFAEFSGGSWVAADGFTFKAGKGYMYYTQGNGGKSVNWGTPDPSAAKAYDGTFFAKSNAPRMKIWEYDNSRFADNMPIVAILSDIDNLEDYSVGAFVGDECRGEGHVVAGKYLFINVAGVGGETVTFKLYNKLDGTYSDLDNTLTYGGKAGSLKNPIALHGGTTGIRSISIGDSKASITITNAAGTVVRNTVGTSISLEGLPSGMYIITVNDGSRRINKKILK